MSLEAIKQITDTEQQYQQRKKEAAANAQKLIIDAERGGKAYLEKAKMDAETEVRSLLNDAEKKAAIQAEELMNKAQIRCESLRQAAEQRLDQAVSKIVERIVSV